MRRSVIQFEDKSSEIDGENSTGNMNCIKDLETPTGLAGSLFPGHFFES